MKTEIKSLFLLFVLIAALGSMLAGRVTAQTFTTLYSFTPLAPNGTNGDGAYPQGMVLSGNTLYGMVSHGGSSGNGTLFALKTDGTGFTNLHNFTSDGGNPGGVVISGNTLYGTTSDTVFKINTNGMGFSTLRGGLYPLGAVIISASTLYGTTALGGSSGDGSVFALNTDSGFFWTLYSFTGGSDGDTPLAQLVISVTTSTLYGTTIEAFTGGSGTVFAINTNGMGFRTLHSFNSSSDGNGGFVGLILSGNTLYGVSEGGGSSGNGTVFALNTDGTGFTNLHNFTATSGPSGTNSDGANPPGLIVSGNTLYGTAANGGSAGHGTIFAINTDSTGFRTLYSFSATTQTYGINTDGTNPAGGVVLSGNALYGTATYGGSSGNGTVFSLSFRPQLTIIPSGENVILTWPTNSAGFDYTGYTLQSTTNLVSPVWTTNSPAPVVVNGQNTVTNPISGTQQFYRLSQ